MRLVIFLELFWHVIGKKGIYTGYEGELGRLFGWFRVIDGFLFSFFEITVEKREFFLLYEKTGA